MGTQLDLYLKNSAAHLERLDTLGTATKYLDYGMKAGSKVAGHYKKTKNSVEYTKNNIYYIDKVLTVVGFISPLKTPTKALQRVLDRVEKPVKEVDKKMDAISEKEDTSDLSPSGNKKLYENVEKGLEDASVVVKAARDAITLQTRQVEIAVEALNNFKVALAVATVTDNVAWKGEFTALNTAVEKQFQARNELIEGLKAVFDDMMAEIDDFVAIFEDIDFEKILGQFIDMEAIYKALEVLKKPLDAAAVLIDPIMPLLNAVDALVGLIVDPVIDFIMETLKLDDVLDKAQALFDALIPSFDLLEKMEALLQPLKDFLLEYAIDALGAIPFLDVAENAFFGDVVGSPDKGPTGWGNDVANVLEGDDGDDILDALGDRDEIFGHGGNDILIAGAGSDMLNGGAGNDMFYFAASFTEYELSRDPDTGNIIVSHVKPSNAENSTGVDELVDMDDGDHVVFTDISFTGKQLKEAIIGGSTLNGDDKDNLMFLNSDGTPVNGLHVANGFGGDDQIFGSTENDQLNGGDGDDLLLPGLGDDEANGGAGSDTFQVLAGANREMVVSLLAGTAFGQGRDTLTSIENVIVTAGQNHEVEGNDDANAIYTGDGIDVISGRGGDDMIDAGGEDDYIVGGAGSDVIMAGGGNIDVMISGSAAKAGVSDLYLGGDGYDVVSYTSSSNTIKFDVSDQSDDPRILQTLKDYMSDIEDSGPVEIRAGEHKIIRFDDAGNEVTTDHTVEVEGFMGSDKDDVLYGDPGARMLHGAGGNDTIHTGGTQNIYGGDDDDLILVENVEGGSTALQVYGGGGSDTMSLDAVGEARWFYKVESAIALTLKAFSTSVEGEDLRNTSNAFFSIKPYGVETISLGNFADHAIYAPGGSQTAYFDLMGGDDRFDGENGFADVSAGDGNDVGNFRKGGGIFRGMAGEDYAIFGDSSKENRAFMGADNDLLQILRFKGHADGGGGYDRISFDPSFQSYIVADLAAGTVESFKGVVTNNSDQVGMTLENFEELIATEYNDDITGSDRDEQLIGRGGADDIDGAGGNDKIYGGTGNDDLKGGDGDDLLHGGAGNDDLDGGDGSDTASFVWARPGGMEGELFADVFTGVEVNLSAGTATGAFGSDTLTSIENVIGTGADDVLQGDSGNNLLSGGNGDDEIYGNAGDDVLVTGRGNDLASGGAGDDTIVVGLGNKTLLGGADFDTLDFGTVDGVVTIDFGAGTYDATFIDEVPRWLERDQDGDGVEESDGTEARMFGGVSMTPQDVLEAQASYANGAEDLARVLPDIDDDEFDDFQIDFVKVDQGAVGTFSGIEKVIGGSSGSNIILTDAVNRFDGRVSKQDVIDLTSSSVAMTYNLRTGANDIKLLVGDDVTGIEGLWGGSQNDTFIGDRSANMFTGGDGNDTLKGGGNKDELDGGQGADVLRGGGGKDTVSGQKGKDTLVGNGGNDDMSGGGGNDTMKGGGGNDRMDGGKGLDFMRGGGGDDAISGGKQGDTIKGDKGNDSIDGDGGRDDLKGNAGDDRINGGGGRDRIDGGSGDDEIHGGGGRDVILGGRGNDDLYGDGGPDRFVFAKRDGQDVIHDFEGGVDRIKLLGASADDVRITTLSGSTLIEYGRGDTIEIADFTGAISIDDLL